MKNKKVDCSTSSAGAFQKLFQRRDSSRKQYVFVCFRTVFTEEEDADENGWTTVILRCIQHHCVTKIIGFDVSYGYMCSYGYSAITAIFDK